MFRFYLKKPKIKGFLMSVCWGKSSFVKAWPPREAVDHSRRRFPMWGAV